MALSKVLLMECLVSKRTITGIGQLVLPFERFNITKDVVALIVEQFDEVLRQHDDRPCAGEVGATDLGG